MRKPIQYKIYFFTIIIIGIIGLKIIDNLSFNDIDKKESQSTTRIGYINLNKSKVSQNDLIQLEKFDCDIWMFAEWNGNNFDAYKDFKTEYETIYEIKDSFTYGFYVMAKKGLDLVGSEFDKLNKPYQCDYSKILLENKSLSIAFIHAPPPIPTCNFETDLYIEHLLENLKNRKLCKNTFIIGDFNTTPIQKAYGRIIAKGYKDSFKDNQIMNGTYGFTPVSPKLIRIDYMFYKGRIDKTYAKRFKLKNSDHCGLLADYKIQ
jgi:hypothetical protein